MADILPWFLAAIPIATVLFLMIKLRLGGSRAGAAGWIAAVGIALFAFGADVEMLLYAQTKGALLTLYVLYIVWAALILYFICAETGAIDVIGQNIQRLTNEKELQLLIVGFVFSSFLQGIAGFGVPIAIVAPLLVGMGFSPLVAVAAPAIGHSWSVTFGNMATSFEALLAVTGIDGSVIASDAGLMLGVSCLLCGWAVLMVYGGWHSVRKCWGSLLIISAVMATTQYIFATIGLWTIAGFSAGIAGLFASIVVTRFKSNRDQPSVQIADTNGATKMSLGWALAPYIIFIIVIALTSFVAPIKEFLSQTSLSLPFPELKTSLNWVIPAETGKNINLFNHPGAHLLYTAIITFILYGLTGFYKNGALKTILSKTVKSGVPTSLGMVSMVCMAVVMDHSGMTYRLALGISSLFDQAYPVVAVAIGSLGAFMTGSTTNSNVVFGIFQRHAAEISGYSTAVILAAQTTGASLGSMLAPAKILVGCSTVGLAGQEGDVLAATLKWGIYLVLILGFGLLGILLIGGVLT